MHIAFFILTCISIAWTAHSLRLPQSSSEAPSDHPVIIKFDQPKRKNAGEGSEYNAHPSINDLYLSTLRDTLTGTALQSPEIQPGIGSGLVAKPFNDKNRNQGSVWCESCYTMAGNARLSSAQNVLEQAMRDNVPGDFVETGIWRGGTSIFARAVQRVHGQGDLRRVYACDSFSGLPASTTKEDGDNWSKMTFLSVSLDQVRNNFERFQMLDNNVLFVKGFFSQSLPVLRTHFQDEGRHISVLRGDGDMFESYYDILFNLYEFVPVGGYFICDDCPGIKEAENAVQQFRRHHKITEEILSVRGSASGTFWRKEREVLTDYAYYVKWNSTRKALLS